MFLIGLPSYLDYSRAFSNGSIFYKCVWSTFDIPDKAPIVKYYDAIT